jgi:hypothetical protein
MTAPLVIDFDEAAHRYVVNGEEWLSVTTVLARVGLIDFSGIPRGILEAAQNRGTRVHKAAHYLTEGTLDWDSVVIEERGYVEAAAAFLKAAEFEVLAQERRIAHPTYRYAGTADIIGWWQGRPAVGDYKTGDPDDVAADLQLSAYAEALRAVPPPEWFDFTPATPIARVSIRLFKDGRYLPEVYDRPENARDFSKFLAALTTAQEQLRRGLKGRKAA